MKHTVVCTQKTLAIQFINFPSKICSFDGHDKLDELLFDAIPELAEGLDGGIYRQVKAIWITIDCNDMTETREKEIRETFLNITRKFCRLKA